MSNVIPWQLRISRKRKYQRPLFEDLHFLDIHGLPFPPDWHGTNILENISLRYPGIKALTIDRANITATFFGGREQQLPIRWYKPGFGGYRPTSQCHCGRGCWRFYISNGGLHCHKCTGALYASQVVTSKARPALQQKRLTAFLISAKLYQRTRHRLDGINASWAYRAPAIWKPRRLSDRTMRPRGRYNTRTSLHVS
jgi:hypothetical protein